MFRRVSWHLEILAGCSGRFERGNLRRSEKYGPRVAKLESLDAGRSTRYGWPMRTTLNIDDDVLQAAREIAKRERRSVGAVISDLIRKALESAGYNVSKLSLDVSQASRPVANG
jgi:hypothetical protein